MQGLPGKSLEPLPESRRFDGRKPLSPSVGWVPQQRVPDRGKMDPDLVGSSGFQTKLREAKTREALQDLPVGSGLPSLPGPRRHLLPVYRVTADRGVDLPFLRKLAENNS